MNTFATESKGVWTGVNTFVTGECMPSPKCVHQCSGGCVLMVHEDRCERHVKDRCERHVKDRCERHVKDRCERHEKNRCEHHEKNRCKHHVKDRCEHRVQDRYEDHVHCPTDQA